MARGSLSGFVYIIRSPRDVRQPIGGSDVAHVTDGCIAAISETDNAYAVKYSALPWSKILYWHIVNSSTAVIYFWIKKIVL